MPDSSASHAVLRQRIARLSPQHAESVTATTPTGHDDIDRVLRGGIMRGKLHEISTVGVDDAVSAAGFAAMCARRIGGPIGWLVREKGDRALDPNGLREIGIDPRQLLLVTTPDPLALLRAADEMIRCPAFGAIVIELWSDARRLDLTASRRLVLRAEASGVTAMLLMVASAAPPSAAQSRWAVSAAPSAPLAANAPGAPTLDLELLRQRGGPAGMRWRVEWDRDRACFRAPLSGAVAAVPARRSLADGTGTRRYGTS